VCIYTLIFQLLVYNLLTLMCLYVLHFDKYFVIISYFITFFLQIILYTKVIFVTRIDSML